MGGPAELDEAGDALWRTVEQGWEQPERHDRFIQYAYSAGTLPAAAARYRGQLQERPDDPTAAKMIARITFLATQQALRPAPAPGRPFTRSPLFLVVLLAGALLGAVAGLLWKRRP